MWHDPNSAEFLGQQVDEFGCVTLEVPGAPDRFVLPLGQTNVYLAVARTSQGAYAVLVPQELRPNDAALSPLFQGGEIIQGWRVLRLPRCGTAGEAFQRAYHVISGDAGLVIPGPTFGAREDPPITINVSPDAEVVRDAAHEDTAPHPEQWESLPFCVNLTKSAVLGELAEVAGRDAELAQIVTILLQSGRSSPLLCGEAGVGKTALVEKLAFLSARGGLPPRLTGISILSLDLPALLASSSHKGAVEKNVSQLLDDLENRPHCLLFVDETHNLAEARGDISIAEMLKPRLARGLRLIGATTHADYKAKISKDAALARRFDMVLIAEPDAEQTSAILRVRLPRMERHHGVRVPMALVDQIVAAADEYMPHSRRPDKALALLDRAMAAQSMKGISEGV